MTIGNGTKATIENAPRLDAPSQSKPRLFFTWTAGLHFLSIAVPVVVLAYLVAIFLPEMRLSTQAAIAAGAEAKQLHKAIADDREKANERIKEAEAARGRAVVQEATLLLRQSENLKAARALAEFLKKGSDQ